MKRTVLVTSDLLANLALILTGYGAIVGMDHEGTITYELEGEDAFELGRMVSDIEQELRAYDTGIEIKSRRQ